MVGPASEGIQKKPSDSRPSSATLDSALRMGQGGGGVRDGGEERRGEGAPDVLEEMGRRQPRGSRSGHGPTAPPHTARLAAQGRRPNMLGSLLAHLHLVHPSITARPRRPGLTGRGR